jgi:lysylphosphatidylglycerol synthetase-like protein (DUF2156 family)
MDLGCVILIVVSAIHGYILSTRYKTCRISSRTKTIWCPNDFVSTLYCVYSPAHALLWMVTTWENLILIVIIMMCLSKQVCVY